MNCRIGYHPLLVALLLAAFNLQAHDPFDGSAQMTVRSDDIEITVTFGTDAARRVLSAAGFSNENISDLFKPRGPRGHQTLPASVASQFFSIRAGDETLTARSATLLFEGMEVIFTLNYPRSPARTLDVRAVYYETIPEMRQGSFVAYDESARQLGAALLSRGSSTTKVLWPTKTSHDSTASTSASASDIPTAAAPRSSFAESFKSGAGLRLFLVGLLVFGVVLVSGYWLLKRTSFTR